MGAFVALTTTVEPEGGPYGKPMIALYSNYVAVLDRVGLSAVLITPAHSARSIRRLLASAAGLVLSGGEDIEPSRYGEDPHPELGLVHPARDNAEYRALTAALRCEMPILGLCRGHQLLNVYFGGTLYQDIATEMPGQLTHYQMAEWGEHHHDALVRRGTLLDALLDDWELQINSFHHQAIRDLAPELVISALAEDGMIEAVEHRDYPWMLGVQWHPERHEASAPISDPNRRIFQGFRDAVLAFDRGHRSPRRRTGLTSPSRGWQRERTATRPEAMRAA